MVPVGSGIGNKGRGCLSQSLSPGFRGSPDTLSEA